MSVITTDISVTDSTEILVTLQVGRNESTADISDIHVRDHYPLVDRLATRVPSPLFFDSRS